MSANPSQNRIPRESLSDAVYQQLRGEILGGVFDAGFRLSQVQLAERYGVSRIPIREALRRLQAESLIEAAPYHTFLVRDVTSTEVLELVDIRAALEDLALARRQPLSTDEIESLKIINEQMVEAGKGVAWFELDRKFHEVIAGSSSRTSEMIVDVRSRLQQYVRSMVAGQPGRETATQEHTAIIEALEAQDMGLARERMRQHIMQSRAFVQRRLLLDPPR